MAHPKNLNLEERKKIQTLIEEGRRNKFIGFTIGRSKFCIFSELKKWKEKKDNAPYSAEEAHEMAKQRRISKNKKKALKDLHDNEDLIFKLIEEGWTVTELSIKFQKTRFTVRKFLNEKGWETGQRVITKSLDERIACLEMQIKILTNQIKELKNDKSK